MPDLKDQGPPATPAIETPAAPAAAAAPAEVPREQIEASVITRLNEIFEDDGPLTKPEQKTPASGETPSDGETDQDEAGEAAKPTAPEAAAEEPTDGSDAPLLPDSHRRTLEAYGWDKTEIDDNLARYGSKFLETSARLHTERNARTMEMAEAGRRAKEAAGGQSATEAAQPRPAQSAQGISAIPQVDTKALKEEYGEDTLVDAIAAPVNAAINAINSLLPQLQQAQQSAQQAEFQQLSTKIDEFFGASAMKPYGGLYGDGSKSLTSDQVATRNKMLETADAIITGAGYQGRNVPLDQALLMAHDLVSQDFKVQAIRSDLKGKLTERSKGISLRPSHRAAGDPGAGRDTLVERTRARLAKAFN